MRIERIMLIEADKIRLIHILFRSDPINEKSIRAT